MSSPLRPLRFLALAAACAAALAPEEIHALDRDTPLAQLGHDAWPDGLPQNSVSAIAQTRDGYLWLGTYEGLVRWNGVEFRVFDRRNAPGLTSSSVVSLLEDGAARLLVGTMGGGLVRREGGRFLALTSKDGLPSDHVFALALDGDAVWAGTGNGAALVVGGSRVVKTLLPGRIVRSILKRRDGTLWFGTTSDGVHRWDGRTLTRLGKSEGLPHDDVEALAEDAEGALWIGTYGGGLARLEGERLTTFTTKDGLPIDLVYSLLVDRQGTLWIGTDTGGLVRRRGGRFETFPSADTLSRLYVRTLHEDREGSLWIGSNAGLDRLKDQKLAGFTKKSGLASESVRSLCETAPGEMLVGGENGVDLLRDGTIRPFPGLSRLPNRYVRALLQDDAGTLWIATNGGGLGALHRGVLTIYTTKDGLGSNVPNALFVDRGGTLWVGTYGGGLAKKEGARFTSFGPKDGLTNLNIRTLAEDRAGDLWVGTDEGLFRRRGATFTRFGTSEGLADPVVLVLKPEDDGTLWIATGGGLQRFDGTRFATLTTDRGLLADKVFSLLEDREGSFWMSTNRGLYAAKKSDLIAAAEGKLARVPGLVLTRTDGMPSAQCNGATQPAAVRSRDGRLWFPTVEGVACVDTSSLRRNTIPPPVVVDALLVDGREVDTTAKTTLDAGTETLEVRYDALSLVAPEKVRFRYRLVGYDATWVDAASRRSAYFTHLSPGTYRFEVTATNDDGVAALAPASIVFEKRPHLYQTWVFRTALVLGLLGLAVSSHVLRNRRHRAREAELEALVARRTKTLEEARLAAERHEQNAQEAMHAAQEANRLKSAFLATTSHELRTPLNAIIGYSELLADETRETLSPAWREDLLRIHKAGQHLLTLINSILDLSKLEAGKMELSLDDFEVPALVEEVDALVRPAIEAGRNVLSVELAPGVGTFYGDRIRTKQVLVNLLSNAAKFTEKGRVSLRVSNVNGRESGLRFVVADTGIGMSEEQLRRLFVPFVQADASTTRRYGGTGLGLALSKRFCELMGGSIAVRSVAGGGTTFEVTIPSPPRAAAS